MAGLSKKAAPLKAVRSISQKQTYKKLPQTNITACGGFVIGASIVFFDKATEKAGLYAGDDRSRNGEINGKRQGVNDGGDEGGGHDRRVKAQALGQNRH